MITIGVDAHKRVHAAVALDDAGGELAQWRGPNSAEGWQQVAAWAAALGPDCRWGIEGAWNYGRGLAQFLVEAGVVVYEVNPRWTAQRRRTARTRGKSDRLDARAVALLVRGEASTLPAVAADDVTATLELLSTERDDAVAEATRLRNQVHQVLLHLDPEYTAHLPKLRTKAGLRALERYETADPRPLQQQRAGTVRRLGQRLRLAQEHARYLAAQIRELAASRFAPLAQICGIDLLTAGTLAGILGPGRRFATDAQLAAYAGAAPLETSSAERVRYRLNRGGNRRLNAILYRIVLTQSRYAPQAQAYLARRMTEGKTRREAVRALKRFVVRAIWRRWQECLTPEAMDCTPFTRPPGKSTFPGQ
ncbi:MAG: IS110 family transposase [Thermoleophilaceae bacterium]|nr:IS110 family transposase [Thermoleophilaceae bacterium]